MGTDFRYKRFGFMPNVDGLKLFGSSQSPGSFFDHLSVGMKMWLVNLVGYYRVLDQPDLSLDLVGGARYLYAYTNLAFTGGLVGNKPRQPQIQNDQQDLERDHCCAGRGGSE